MYRVWPWRPQINILKAQGRLGSELDNGGAHDGTLFLLLSLFNAVFQTLVDGFFVFHRQGQPIFFFLPSKKMRVVLLLTLFFFFSSQLVVSSTATASVKVFDIMYGSVDQLHLGQRILSLLLCREPL
jgi:hypothetical protein